MRDDLLRTTKRTVKKALSEIGVLDKFNFKLTKYANGKRFKIPVVQEIGLANLSSSEEWMTKVLEVLLNLKKGAFVDVGVNVGQTLIKLKSLDPLREYVGFEPNPACVFYVRQLISENGLVNCVVVPAGLYDSAGILQLEYLSNDETCSAASIIKGFRSPGAIRRREYVPVFPLSQIRSVFEVGEISIIKIDVEGAELEVIRSAHQTIGEDRPFIVIEVLPVYSPENKMRKARQDELETMITDLGYRIFRVIQTNTGDFGGVLKLTTIGIHSDLSQSNYVFVPHEIEKTFVQLMLKDPVRP